MINQINKASSTRPTPDITRIAYGNHTHAYKLSQRPELWHTRFEPLVILRLLATAPTSCDHQGCRCREGGGEIPRA